MPIYEYVCDACGRMFEKIHLSAAPDAMAVACPGCGSAGVTRQFSRFAAHGASPGSSRSSRSGGNGDKPSSGGGCGRPGGCGCA